MLRLVFDLDETLVATREANRAAYAEIGVTLPPESDHRPHAEWRVAIDPEARQRKHEVFEKHLRQRGRLLPAHRFLYVNYNSVVILTGTSQESWCTICRLFPNLSPFPAHCNMGPDAKIKWLLAQTQTGIYFDDWDYMVRRVREETSWQAINVTGF